MSKLKPWKVLRSTYRLREKWMVIRQDTAELPDGRVIDDFFVRESPDVVLIVAERPDGLLILNQQYKHGCGKIVIEPPAGAVDPGETPLQAAQRELGEETGYAADVWHLVGTFLMNPTSANGHWHIYYVTGCKEVGNKITTDSREEIENFFWTWEETLAATRDGRISALGAVAGLLLADDFRKKIARHD